jgi:hypothetical protein
LDGKQEDQTRLFMEPQLGSDQEKLIKVQAVSRLVLRQDRPYKVLSQLLLVIVQVLKVKVVVRWQLGMLQAKLASLDKLLLLVSCQDGKINHKIQLL